MPSSEYATAESAQISTPSAHTKCGAVTWLMTPLPGTVCCT
jgi:hypothetical protein